MSKPKSPGRLKSEKMGYTKTDSTWTPVDELKFLDGLGGHCEKRPVEATRPELLEKYIVFMSETRRYFGRINPVDAIKHAREALNANQPS
jgi:hypothetical protein